MTVIAALLAMGIFASAASLFLKKSTDKGLDFKRLIMNPYLYLGGSLYIISALLNLYLLKKLPYSIVVPLGSLTYIWTLIIAYKCLKERITKNKLIGVISILIGVISLTVF